MRSRFEWRHFSQEELQMLRKTMMLSFIATLPLAACQEKTVEQPEIRPVRTLIAEPKPVNDDQRVVGEVRPRYESELGFRVSGKIISRTAEVGEIVKKGDVLARLDEQDHRNKVKSAETDLVANDAVLVEARNAEERSRQLLSTGSTTRAIYDSALKNLRSAEARSESAKTALEMAKDQLAYSELHAEFDGVITAVGGEVGQIVSSGKMIVRVARPGDKDAVFSISESAFSEKNGSGRPEVVVSLLSSPDISADGVLREISPMADPATRTYQVKVTLTNAPEQMRFGASVVGRNKASTTPVVVLPASALFDRSGRPAVWIVNMSSRQVDLKDVTVARYETDRVIVSDGLTKGDIVVTAGVNRLREGQKVRLTDGRLS